MPSNADLAPVPASQRTWQVKEYAFLWLGVSFSVPAYMLASSLIVHGMAWWQTLGLIFLGNVIVLIPMLLNSHAGVRYGISFPVLARSSFGMVGANIPAIIRALIACGWFGIQTWVGAQALVKLLLMGFPDLASIPSGPLLTLLDLRFVDAMALLIMWLVLVTIICLGIGFLRRLLAVQSILLLLIVSLFFVWFFATQDIAFILGSQLPHHTVSWGFIVASLTGIVGYFSTICLNIPDFTRYARSQKDQIIGQTLALPLAMTMVTFLGIAVTSVTYTRTGHFIWNPVDLVDVFPETWTRLVLLSVIIFITLVANISLNIVSPANDISHLYPRRINFRLGGIITTVIGLMMLPWKLIADPNGYIFIWLTGVSSLLGSVVAILIVDYYSIRHHQLDIDALYRRGSIYEYSGGFNGVAFVALIIGIGINVPGFLQTIHVLENVPTLLQASYSYAWFTSLLVSGVIYRVLMGFNK